MNGLTNIIQNSGLAGIAQGASRGVVNAIASASASTGVDFAYLVQQAKAESSFNPSAQAKTSSASGLFQFIESTWESMIEKYGDKHGIDTAGKSRDELLALRKDPVVASNMAAEFAGENERFLERNYGGDIGSTELYFAHFMGAGGAASFLNAKDANGSDPAAVLFPKAAAANKNVFYESGSGRAKSLDEVYAFFDAKFSVKDAAPIEDAQPVSVVYASADKATPNYNGLYNPEHVAAQSPLSSSLPFYDLVHSPLEIMLLSQLESPWSNDS
ncbi:MAG: transglycosylase SLT domain-containing protein [Alphaproteobacteria bacterium]